MNEYLPSEETPQPERLQIRIGNEIVTVSAADTFIRRFDVGGGMYDHCVKQLEDGRLFAFSLTPETMEALQELGYRVCIDAEPDAATRAHFNALMDAELRRLTKNEQQ